MGQRIAADQTSTRGSGPKFTLDVEQVAELGGWDISQGVILIDLRDNTERALEPDEVVVVRPGLGFSKRVRFKRG